jgi:hypothetical protein
MTITLFLAALGVSHAQEGESPWSTKAMVEFRQKYMSKGFDLNEDSATMHPDIITEYAPLSLDDFWSTVKVTRAF